MHCGQYAYAAYHGIRNQLPAVKDNALCSPALDYYLRRRGVVDYAAARLLDRLCEQFSQAARAAPRVERPLIPVSIPEDEVEPVAGHVLRVVAGEERADVEYVPQTPVLCYPVDYLEVVRYAPVRIEQYLPAHPATQARGIACGHAELFQLPESVQAGRDSHGPAVRIGQGFNADRLHLFCLTEFRKYVQHLPAEVVCPGIEPVAHQLYRPAPASDNAHPLKDEDLLARLSQEGGRGQPA